MFNNRGPQDTRHALTGKDGAMFNSNGVMLYTMETFKSEINITNTNYQPLGDAQEHDVFSSFKISLSCTQIIIEDDEFIKEMFRMMDTGWMPEWNFQGVLRGRNGSEQRVVYRQCVPNGTIDLQNFSVGDLVKRNWSFTVNDVPDLQKLLSYT